VQLSRAWMGMGCYGPLLLYLRSNISQTALVATLDTYDFMIMALKLLFKFSNEFPEHWRHSRNFISR
jgi:hypothetical protein